MIFKLFEKVGVHVLDTRFRKLHIKITYGARESFLDVTNKLAVGKGRLAELKLIRLRNLFRKFEHICRIRELIRLFT